MKIDKVFSVSQYTIMIAVFGALIGQLLMLYIGAVKVYKALKFYILKEDIRHISDHLLHSDVATAILIQSLDAFLFAVVLMYFAFALYHLFVSRDANRTEILFPGNIAPKNIGDLKQILAEVIVVILFILFLQEIWLSLDNLQWTLLILPGSIALLALSLKLVSFKE